jgi:hypothetical protein
LLNAAGASSGSVTLDAAKLGELKALLGKIKSAAGGI